MNIALILDVTCWNFTLSKNIYTEEVLFRDSHESEEEESKQVLTLHFEISAFFLTWVPKQAAIIWVRSLAANMAHLVQKRWEMIAKVKPTQKW